jgi:outer membrane protein assembly factor BamB
MKPKTSLVVAFCFGLLTLTVRAGDWRGFRGPEGQGIASDKNLPTTWDDMRIIAWKTKLPGPGASSPITLGDRVYVTCYSGYGTDNGGKQADLTRHFLCLDRLSGEIKWTRKIPAKLPETPYGGFITQHGYAASTPATDGERVYVFFGKSGVFAFDLDGKQLWKASVGTRTHGWGSASSPVLYKGLVIINAGVESGAVVALNKKTGKPVWRYGGIQRSWSTPVLVELSGGKTELALSVPGKIVGIDPDNGKELWHCDGIDDYICPSVVARDGIVYAIGGRQHKAVAVRAAGRGDVTKTHRLWEQFVGSNVSSPVLVGDYLYWVSDAGVAYCVKAATGEMIYGERLQGAGRVYASAVAADGKLYVVTRDKGTFVLAARPKFEVLAHNTFRSDESIFNGSPAVTGGQLFLRSDQYLYCIGKK